MGAASVKEERMRLLSLMELNRLSRAELMALLRVIAAELPQLEEGSAELRWAHANLANIRAALAKPKPGFRP
jgi:hypothetical protein